jgi:hypothetical protein
MVISKYNFSFTRSSSCRAFLIQVPATVLAMVLVSFVLRLPNTESANFFAKLKRVDFTGSVTLVVMIFALLFGLDRGANVSWNDKFVIAALAAFVVLFVLFGVIEMAIASEPIAPKRIIVNRALIASYMVNLFGLASIYTMIFNTSLYLQAVLSKSPSETGLWLLPAILGGVVGSLGGGLIMKATGRYYWLTVWSYGIALLGGATLTLSTGILSTSLSGIGTGASSPMIIVLLVLNNSRTKASHY